MYHVCAGVMSQVAVVKIGVPSAKLAPDDVPASEIVPAPGGAGIVVLTVKHAFGLALDTIRPYVSCVHWFEVGGGVPLGVQEPI